VGMAFVGLTGGVMTWVLAMIESRAAPWRSA
jgi:ABC-type nitrate/sulfonate/bicarbonate transport system permease component